MKILQLVQRPQLRGAEIFACLLSGELERLGHQSLVVSVFDGDIQLPFYGRVLSLHGVPSRRFFDFGAWKSLAKIVAAERPDIVQANAGDTLKYAVLSKLMFRWKAPVVFRNASTISAYMKSRLVVYWNMFLFLHVTRIVSVSEFSRRDLTRLFPVLAARTFVIPIGITVTSPVREPTPAVSTPTFIHIGGFSFEKNHKGLIDIYKSLKSRYPGSRLDLVGDGPVRPEIEALILREGVKDVVFHGSQPDPQTYLERSDCLLLPSIIEGMPSVVLEAFRSRVPVVAFDVGGVSEIIAQGETGWLVARNDNEGFVEAVCEAIGDQTKRSRVTQAAYQLVEKNFSLPVIARRFDRTYRELL